MENTEKNLGSLECETAGKSKKEKRSKVNRDIKLVAIERNDTPNMVCRGVLALARGENKDIKQAEYRVIGKSCSCSGLSGGWTDVQLPRADVVEEPILMQPLLIGPKGKIAGRYFGDVIGVTEVPEGAYKTAVKSVTEREKRKEITEIANKIVVGMAQGYRSDARFHSNFIAIASSLEGIAEGIKRKPKVPDKQWLEALKQFSDEEINQYTLAAQLFIRCLEYRGRLEGAGLAVRALSNYCSNERFAGSEKWLDKSALSDLIQHVFDRVEKNYEPNMRGLDLAKGFIDLK